MGRMDMKFFGFIILCALQLFSCSRQEGKEEVKILTGWMTDVQLLQELPEYRSEKNAYQPESDAMHQLKSINDEFEVLIFLGTYCPDCKREVPRFLKINEQVQIKYRMFVLNRTSADQSGMREKYQIEFIPTFIVYHRNQEIGRIIERPIVSIENDLLEICSALFSGRDE